MNVLNENELKSAVWLKLKAHLEERLESVKSQLEGDKGPDETYKLRGRIAEIRLQLSLEAPLLKVVDPRVDYS